MYIGLDMYLVHMNRVAMSGKDTGAVCPRPPDPTQFIVGGGGGGGQVYIAGLGPLKPLGTTTYEL